MADHVIFGGPPYEEGANQTSLQMFQEIGRNERVIYVCRRQQGSALRRLLGRGLVKKATSLRPGLWQLGSNKHILVLPHLSEWLPTVTPEFLRRIQVWIIKTKLIKAIKQLGYDSPVLTSYWWMFPEVSAMKIWSKRVFDVIDRHWGYEYLVSRDQAARNLELSLQTARNSNLVFAVSDALVEELFSAGIVQVKLLENAVDIRRVRNALLSGNFSNGRRRAVYCGGWNDRLDLDLLRYLVQRNGDWDFYFVGSNPDVDLRLASNAHFLGDQSYDLALAIIGSSTLGLVPFKKNEYTEASNFLKVLDYLACGIHVGTTGLNRMKEWRDQMPDRVRVCEDREQWDGLFDSLASSELGQKHSSESSTSYLNDWDTSTRKNRLVGDNATL